MNAVIIEYMEYPETVEDGIEMLEDDEDFEQLRDEYQHGSEEAKRELIGKLLTYTDGKYGYEELQDILGEKYGPNCDVSSMRKLWFKRERDETGNGNVYKFVTNTRTVKLSPSATVGELQNRI